MYMLCTLWSTEIVGPSRKSMRSGRKVPFACANNSRIVLDATFVLGTYNTRAFRATNTWPLNFP